MKKTRQELEVTAAKIRKNILRALKPKMQGHVGGAMSIADTLAVLYGEQLNYNASEPKWDKRDRVVMSKGHCGPAMYATLALHGFFDESILDTCNTYQSSLPSHCDKNRVIGIDMTTGSLGQGMSTALGIAWGLRYQKNPAYTYIILGDGECDEGQVWEGALFASTKKLSNVIAFVDRNHKQLDGYTKDICDVGDIAKKFEEFGWFAQDIDGHDVIAISEAIDKAKESDKPSIIVLQTVKGKDCVFAEDVYHNHHIAFTEEMYNNAVSALDEKINRIVGDSHV